MGRFDYVNYDDQAKSVQMAFKERFEDLEKEVSNRLKTSREQSIILTKLEEAYAWIGKAVRDEQITRSGGAVVNESRGFS